MNCVTTDNSVCSLLQKNGILLFELRPSGLLMGHVVRASSAHVPVRALLLQLAADRRKRDDIVHIQLQGVFQPVEAHLRVLRGLPGIQRHVLHGMAGSDSDVRPGSLPTDTSRSNRHLRLVRQTPVQHRRHGGRCDLADSWR